MPKKKTLAEVANKAPLPSKFVAAPPAVELRRSTRIKVSATVPEPESDLDSVEDEKVIPIKPTKRKRKTKQMDSEDSGEPEEVPEQPAKKARKPRAPKTEPVYIIPDVERKETTFRGRLGYACLNTVLRNKKPASETVFCSRTCRLDSLKKNGMDWVKELGKKNAADAIQLIKWNEENKIRFMRLSSEMFPFASHPIHGYNLAYCDDVLKEVGRVAKEYGHRLTMHPGQFTQLGSPKLEVRANAVRELVYHAELMDRMGLDQDGVMIVHGGGVYDSKEDAMERIKKTVREDLPPNVRARLVLENDELCYSAEDLLPLCEELDVPLVFDYHHDSINPSSIPPSAIIARANAIFARRGIKPKQHLSQPRPGAVTVMERRAHSDRCDSLPAELEISMGLVGEDGKGVDLMIEAKDKEQAVLELYRIYGLEEVKHESLRPPKENQTKETLGRKSAAKKRIKAGEVVDDEVPAVDVEEVVEVETLPKTDADHDPATELTEVSNARPKRARRQVQH